MWPLCIVPSCPRSACVTMSGGFRPHRTALLVLLRAFTDGVTPFTERRRRLSDKSSLHEADLDELDAANQGEQQVDPKLKVSDGEMMKCVDSNVQVQG